jgi:hypothetical protein
MSNEEERRQLLEFFKNQNITEDEYKLTPKHEDPPDALVNKDGLQISLEHTRLMKQDLKELSALQNRVLSKAKAILSDWNKYSVHVLFKPSANLTYNNRNKFTQEIVETIQEASNIETDKRTRIEGKNTIIYIRNSYNFEHNKWQCPSDNIGWVTETNDQLFELILRKQKNIPRYRVKFDKNWLLIYIDRYKSYGMFEIDFNQKIESSFNKVFIMYKDNILEIHSD